eukprot:gnl/Chilomastix_cuspidata/3321.p1 GENE.gnl/Chilomastix_cuspidata/3321~~gnl/Chilomastix_cuspidata/3321.p1  ORF type:complete len:366 (+),score=104.32 gnl/Chilomastix_cuspidata/3321:30-1100(+)
MLTRQGPFGVGLLSSARGSIGAAHFSLPATFATSFTSSLRSDPDYKQHAELVKASPTFKKVSTAVTLAMDSIEETLDKLRGKVEKGPFGRVPEDSDWDYLAELVEDALAEVDRRDKAAEPANMASREEPHARVPGGLVAIGSAYTPRTGGGVLRGFARFALDIPLLGTALRPLLAPRTPGALVSPISTFATQMRDARGGAFDLDAFVEDEVPRMLCGLLNAFYGGDVAALEAMCAPTVLKHLLTCIRDRYRARLVVSGRVYGCSTASVVEARPARRFFDELDEPGRADLPELSVHATVSQLYCVHDDDGALVNGNSAFGRSALCIATLRPTEHGGWCFTNLKFPTLDATATPRFEI